MNKIRLEQISLKHENEIYRIKKEYDEINDDYNGAFFIKEIESYDKLINDLNNYSKGIMDNPNYVPYICYVVINEDNKIIGVGSLRYELNDYLLKYAGHIGYSVVPSERRKGYGTKILELLLEEAKKRNIDKILLTCNSTNIGSMKIIEKNGGKLENEISHDSIITKRYWVD